MIMFFVICIVIMFLTFCVEVVMEGVECENYRVLKEFSGKELAYPLTPSSLLS